MSDSFKCTSSYFIFHHFVYTTHPAQGLWGSWRLFQRELSETWGKPWTGCQSITELRHSQKNKVIPTGNIEFPLHLTGMSLNLGRRPAGNLCRLQKNLQTLLHPRSRFELTTLWIIVMKIINCSPTTYYQLTRASIELISELFKKSRPIQLGVQCTQSSP